MNEAAAMELLRRGTMLAARVKSTSQNTVAWIGVYPLDLSRSSTREYLKLRGIFPESSCGQIYHVRYFELPKSIADEDVCIGEEKLGSKSSSFAATELDLRRELRKHGVDLSDLQHAFECNYPI